MKLQRKLGLGFLLVAVCLGIVNAVWIGQARLIKGQFDQFAEVTISRIIALWQAESSALRMAEAAVGQAGEDGAFEAARKEHSEWVAHYKKVAGDAEHDKLISAVEKTGEAVRQRAEDLIAKTSDGSSQAELDAAQNRLFQARQRLRLVIEKAMRPELGLLVRQKAALAARVRTAEPVSVAAAGVVASVALLLAAWLARSIADPIVRLAQDARTVGSGNLGWRTGVRSRDEIGQLAEAFNRMTENLQRTTVSKRFVDNVITSMADALIVINPEGTIRSVNPAAITLLGYPEAELAGLPVDKLFADRRGGNNALARAGLEAVLVGASLRNVERQWETKEGRAFPVLCSASAVLGEDGDTQALVCVALDITELKRAEEALRRAYDELKQAQDQLVQSEKLSALGRFAAGIAHEVKNPLGIVLGGVEFLESQLSVGSNLQPIEETRTSLAMIKDAVQRADTIVRDLLKFARPSQLKREPVALSGLVQETIALLTYGGSLKKVQTQTQFATGAISVEVDKNQIQQVLLNLMMNAIDAMGGAGKLFVRTRLAQDPGKTLAAIEIEDTGEGIRVENLSRLFEPFFTTKRDKKGTGLGLSISKTIVESHGGSISVASQVGKGTVFTVVLPAVEEGVRT